MDRDSATFVDVAEQWAGITAADDQSVLQGIGGPVGGISEPILPAFGATDHQFTGLDVVVAKIQG